MAECPSCRTAYEQPQDFCNGCGRKLNSEQTANVTPEKRKLTIGQGCGLGCFGFIALFAVLLFIAAVRKDHGRTDSNVAGIGDVVTVRDGNGFWPCGSTPEAFDELMKWAAGNDNAELRRAMVATRSIALEGGMKVKILGSGFGKRKVRVMTNSEGTATLNDEKGKFSADPRIGRACWVVSEALPQ